MIVTKFLGRYSIREWLRDVPLFMALISSLLRRVGVSVHAIDFCDPALTIKATVVPGHAVKDGDTILIQGETRQIQLATTTLSLAVTGEGVSGNQTSAHAVSSVSP